MFERIQQMKEMSRDMLAKMVSKPKDKTVRAHVPPSAKTWKAIQKLEKKAGALPLSLRAFYHVVGEVDFIGTHPSIAARESSVAPDPLVVYGVHTAIEALEDDDRIILAPDALHKADTSGGDPYSMVVPAPYADAPVEMDCGSMNFVEYLRDVFAWGGFPGWKQGDAVLPQEIRELSQGLLPI